MRKVEKSKSVIRDSRTKSNRNETVQKKNHGNVRHCGGHYQKMPMISRSNEKLVVMVTLILLL